MTPHSPPISEFPNKQIVLVLCGLIGSGKSTFALFLSSHFPTFIRCNQDDLGTRTAVYQLAESSLRQGLSVCIDRCNFDPEQRRVWTELARKWGVSVWALGLNTSQEVCADRLLHRPPHPTVPPHHALSILARFAHQYTPPTYAEDFDRILCLADGARGYAREDMESLLRHIGEQVRPCARAQVLPKQEQGEGEVRDQASSSVSTAAAAGGGRGSRGKPPYRTRHPHLTHSSRTQSYPYSHRPHPRPHPHPRSPSPRPRTPKHRPWEPDPLPEKSGSTSPEGFELGSRASWGSGSGGTEAEREGEGEEDEEEERDDGRDGERDGERKVVYLEVE